MLHSLFTSVYTKKYTPYTFHIHTNIISHQDIHPKPNCLILTKKYFTHLSQLYNPDTFHFQTISLAYAEHTSVCDSHSHTICSNNQKHMLHSFFTIKPIDFSHSYSYSSPPSHNNILHHSQNTIILSLYQDIHPKPNHYCEL